MTSTGYSAVVDDKQRARLDRAHRAVERAERAETAAREHRNNVLVDLAEHGGYGATAIARALNADPAPWRAVHRTTVQDAIGPAAGGPGGAGRDRLRQRAALEPVDAERARAAHRALYEAGRALDAALDRRAAVFVELHGEGVSMRDQASALGVAHATVQVPITAASRAAGQPRRSRRRA